MNRISVIVLGLVALFAVSCCGGSGSCSCKNGFPTNKKEVMDRFLDGTLDTCYVPAAFFIHFGGSEGQAAINAQLQYYLKTNMDILKVQLEQLPSRITDIDKQETWDNITPMPKDFYRPTVEVIKGIYDVVGQDVYVLPTIYSPFQVARQALGEVNIAVAAREHPEELKRIMGYYADALLWLVEECKSFGIEGFYTATQGGEMKFYDIPGFYDDIVRPFDLRVINACNDGTKLNILHICDWEGTYDDLTRYKDYPGQIVSTPLSLNGKPFTVSDGVQLFGRPVIGGLNRKAEIVKGTEADVENAVRKALDAAPTGKVMLGAECTVGGASIANIHKAVYTAHHR